MTPLQDLTPLHDTFTCAFMFADTFMPPLCRYLYAFMDTFT